MKALLATFRPFGAAVLQRVLGYSPTEVRITGVGDRSSVLSAGHWSLRHYGCRAVVVVDSESTFEHACVGLEVDMVSLMINRDVVTVHMAVPEAAVVLFASPEHLAGILGIEITPEELIRAEYVPGEILDSLVARSPRVHSRDELMEQVSDEYACRMRAHPLVRQVECSIERAMASPLELLPGDVEPFYHGVEPSPHGERWSHYYGTAPSSSHATESPTWTSPSSSTSAKAPPPHSERMAS